MRTLRKRSPYSLLGTWAGTAIREITGRFLRTLETDLPCNPARLLVGMCPEDAVAHCGDARTAKLTAALVTKVRKWNGPDVFQLKEGSAMERCCVYTMGFYAAVKKDGIMKYAGK